MSLTADEVVTIANARHGTRWALVRRLPGGYLQGAYELVGSEGARAVLKWHPDGMPVRKLDAAASMLAAMHARGWPTPRWLAHGSVSDRGAYVVEELLVGEAPTRLDEHLLDALLDAARLQADVAPVTPQNWSEYVTRVVFEGKGGLAARMRRRPLAATLMSRLERLTADARAIALPTRDVVHGDFVLRNVIVSGGRPYLIDAAHAGKGTRAYDLACLLFETTVDDLYATPTARVKDRLRRQCLEIIGRDELLLCIACRMMHWLVFGDQPDDAHLASMVARCESFLDELELDR